MAESVIAPLAVGQRVLIVGTGGVLGTALHAGFESLGHPVMGVGRSASRARRRLRGPLVDLTLPDPHLHALVRDWQPDLCIHCAGPHSVPDSVADPRADFLGTLPPLQSLLQSLAAHSPGTRLIYVSSAAVYGQPAQLPVPVSASIAPLSPYGEHRHQAECLVDDYRRGAGLKACSVRVFSAYGPDLHRQVVWDLCRRAQQDGPLQVWGTGAESRDFVHVNDVVRALALLAGQPEWKPAYNLGSGHETPIAQLADMVVARAGGRKRVQFLGNAQPGLPQRWCADVGELAALGFAPSVSLEDGLDEVWAASCLEREGAACT